MWDIYINKKTENVCVHVHTYVNKAIQTETDALVRAFMPHTSHMDRDPLFQYDRAKVTTPLKNEEHKEKTLFYVSYLNGKLE